MKKDPTRMRLIYDRWLASGLSKKAFSLKEGLNYTTFGYWVKKFENKPSIKSASNNNEGFAKIKFNSSSQGLLPSPLMAINFPTGARLEIFSIVSSEFLREILSQ